MTTPRALFPLLAAALLAACSSGGSLDADRVAGDTELVERFEGGGGLPAGWRTATSNADGARDALWALTPDPSAPSAPGTLALTDARGHEGQHFNLCWNPAIALADVDVRVAVRADGGVEDQGGGPAWRIAGAEDYYLARWNPLEDNFRVYSVVGGVRRQLASARVRTDPGAWHVIRARHVGNAITCWFDGERLLEVTDDALGAAGAVGLWTKADATTSFDDLVAGPAR